MTPRERAREIAEAIFTEWQASCSRYPEGYPSPMGPIVERHIAAALTIPPGHVRDEHGRIIEVPEGHPRTKDGVIVFENSSVWGYNINGELKRERVAGTLESWPSPTIYLSDCYSTREAAEAARGGKQ